MKTDQYNNWHAYDKNGLYQGSGNILTREGFQERFPEWEWLSQDEHDLRQAIEDKNRDKGHECKQEMRDSRIAAAHDYVLASTLPHSTF